jgi:hypothetical protein
MAKPLKRLTHLLENKNESPSSALEPAKSLVDLFEMNSEGVSILFQHLNFFINVDQRYGRFHAHSAVSPMFVMPMMVLSTSACASTAAALN